MSNTYETISEKHAELQNALYDNPENISTEEIYSFIQEISRAGATVAEIGKREQLRSILRYWADVILKRTDDYPTFQLAPHSGPEKLTTGARSFGGRFNLKHFLLLIGGIVIVIALIWLILYQGNTTTETPTPTATAAAISLNTATPTFTSPSTTAEAIKNTATPTLTPTPTSSPTITPTPNPSPTVTPTIEIICADEVDREPIPNTGEFEGSVTITAPKNCTTGLEAASEILMKGEFTQVPNNVQIWILVYPPSQLYYPQSPNACDGKTIEMENGQFSVPIYLGLDDGFPEWFDVVAVLVDEEVNQFIIDWVMSGCINNDYIGIPPEEIMQLTITEKDFITVHTQD